MFIIRNILYLAKQNTKCNTHPRPFITETLTVVVGWVPEEEETCFIWSKLQLPADYGNYGISCFL